MNEAVILNVDDDEAGRYARSRVLQRAGFRVLEAATGIDALSIVAREKPAVVLLDINLPDIDGIEVTQRIKQNPEWVSVAVMQISASRVEDADRIEALDRGADTYIAEPVHPAVLIATVRSMLRAREAEEELRHSNERLRRFSYVVAHDLKEPMRAVSSYAQLLQSRYRGRLGSDADEFIGFIIEGVGRMNTFIQDVLRYSETSEAELDCKPVSLDSVLMWALMEVHGAIRETAAEITRDPLPELCVDAMRMTQLFTNLLGNAMKYRGAEPPRIHVSAFEQQHSWVISVRDNGVGIDPKYQDQVFVLFKRLHGRDTPGSGVGLAICKEIVERHGGRIWVESTPGKGSTFSFSIPKNAQ
ncbi:MAG TPA: ATP-binding protein [Bryobacteraceae bacterium]|nr:ATP-binding protein [Bryobacteraceae bacterium]